MAYDPHDDGLYQRSVIEGNSNVPDAPYYRAIVNPDGSLRVSVGGSGGSSITVNQGTPNTLANAWPVKITDGTNSLSILTTDPTLSSAGLVVRNIPWGTYETILVNDTVFLQAEVQEGIAAPVSTTVLVTGGLDASRLARPLSIGVDGRPKVSIRGTVAPRWSHSRKLAAVTTTPTYILGLQNTGLLNSVASTLLMYLDNLCIYGAVVSHVDVVLNPTITTPTWTAVDAVNSVARYDTSGAGYTGGRVIFGMDVGSTHSLAEDLSNYAITLAPNDVIALVGYVDTGTGDIRVTPNWQEAP